MDEEGLFGDMDAHVVLALNDTVVPLHSYNPSVRVICNDTYMWMWLLSDYDTGIAGYNPNVTAIINYFDTSGGSTGNDAISQSVSTTTKFAVVMPVGTANLNIPANTAYYIITFRANSGALLSGPYRFNISSGCCCDEELYFLDKPGGYTTICVENVSTDVTSTGLTVCFKTECDFKGLYTGGYRALGTRTSRDVTSVIKRVFKTHPALKMYEALLTSESVYRRFNRGANVYWQRITINPESWRLVDNNGLVGIQFTWRTNHDVTKQSIR
jgi:hypothetical protein